MIALSKVSFLLAIVILGIIFSHFLHDCSVKGLVPVGHCDPWHHLLLTVVVEHVPHHDLLLCKPALKVESIFEVKLELWLELLGGLGLCWGDEAEVVEERLLHPALTTLVIRFEASAILILWPPALQASSTPTEQRVAGQ